MIPKYDAIDIRSIIQQYVGRTMPWEVVVDVANNPNVYVTKLFTSPQNDIQNAVVNEVVCNLLAREFDLPVPDIGLIDIEEELAVSKGYPYDSQFLNSDPRIKFGSEYIPNAITFSSGLPKKIIQSRIDIGTLYAFDNLIRNADRGSMKPNLLLVPNSAVLIDHELAFQSRYLETSIDLDYPFEEKFTNYHIFYPYLKSSNRATKDEAFNTFTEYLNTLNLSKLNSSLVSLQKEGYTIPGDIIPWLTFIKSNSAKFVQNLRASIQ